MSSRPDWWMRTSALPGVAPRPKNHEIAAGFRTCAESGSDVIIAACLSTQPRLADRRDLEALFLVAL